MPSERSGRGARRVRARPSAAADLAAACGDDDRAVRLAASRSLSRVNGPDDPSAARTLIALLADPGPVADRPEILKVIGGLNDAAQDRAVAARRPCCRMATPAVIPDVLVCLPLAGPRAKAALPALEAMLDHGEPALRGGAGLAIIAIEGGPGLASPPNAAPAAMGMAAMLQGGGGGMGMAGGAALALSTPASGGQVNPRVVAVLTRILGDAGIPLEVRANALGMTQAIDPAWLAKATPGLVRQLADPDPNVRRTALELLSSIIDATPVELPAAGASSLGGRRAASSSLPPHRDLRCTVSPARHSTSWPRSSTTSIARGKDCHPTPNRCLPGSTRARSLPRASVRGLSARRSAWPTSQERKIDLPRCGPGPVRSHRSTSGIPAPVSASTTVTSTMAAGRRASTTGSAGGFAATTSSPSVTR